MKKSSIKNKSIKALIYSVLCGIASFIIFLLFFALILTKYDISHEKVKYFYIISSVFSGMITGGLSGKLASSKGIIWSSASSLIVSVFILLFILIFNSFNISAFTFLIFPVFIISGAISGIISSNLR